MLKHQRIRIYATLAYLAANETIRPARVTPPILISRPSPGGD
jgi:hypothetical protein